MQGGDSGEVGGDSGEVGGDSGEVGGDSGEVGGDSGEVGGDSGEVGGDSGEVGGDSGEVGGDSGEVGGSLVVLVGSYRLSCQLGLGLQSETLQKLGTYGAMPSYYSISLELIIICPASQHFLATTIS